MFQPEIRRSDHRRQWKRKKKKTIRTSKQPKLEEAPKGFMLYWKQYFAEKYLFNSDHINPLNIDISNKVDFDFMFATAFIEIPNIIKKNKKIAIEEDVGQSSCSITSWNEFYSICLANESYFAKLPPFPYQKKIDIVDRRSFDHHYVFSLDCPGTKRFHDCVSYYHNQEEECHEVAVHFVDTLSLIHSTKSFMEYWLFVVQSGVCSDQLSDSHKRKVFVMDKKFNFSSATPINSITVLLKFGYEGKRIGSWVGHSIVLNNKSFFSNRPLKDETASEMEAFGQDTEIKNIFNVLKDFLRRKKEEHPWRVYFFLLMLAEKELCKFCRKHSPNFQQLYSPFLEDFGGNIPLLLMRYDWFSPETIYPNSFKFRKALNNQKHLATMNIVYESIQNAKNTPDGEEKPEASLLDLQYFVWTQMRRVMELRMLKNINTNFFGEHFDGRDTEKEIEVSIEDIKPIYHKFILNELNILNIDIVPKKIILKKIKWGNCVSYEILCPKTV